MTSRLRARALTLGYADRDVVKSLDLDVLDGRVTAIVGANACGKSTLLRGLARLLGARSGEVVLDVVLRDDEVSLRRQAGVPPTDPNTRRRAAFVQADAEDIPEVEIRPKAEWTDDQGFRVSPTRVAFKRRF